MKAIKLLLIAVALIGVICLLMKMWPDTDPKTAPVYTSQSSIEIKGMIDSLCTDGKWCVEGYKKIDSRIHMDNVQGVIDKQDAKSLSMYLFSSSCVYVKEGLDKLFQQDSYPSGKEAHYESALGLLRSKVAEQGENSNLDEASNLFSAYKRLMATLSFGKRAEYVKPFKAYLSGNADNIKSTILSMKYYKSHFCKNSSIRSKLNSVGTDMLRAEEKYYNDLEKLIEDHYKSTGNMEELMYDQVEFMKISTNDSANSRLNKFVNNPNN